MSQFSRKSPRDWGSGMNRLSLLTPLSWPITALAPHVWLRSLPYLLSHSNRGGSPAPGGPPQSPDAPPNQAGRSLSLCPAWWFPPCSSSTSIGLFFPRSIPLPHAEPLLGRGQPLAAVANCRMSLPVKSGISTAITCSPSIFKPRLSFHGLSRFSAASSCLGAAFTGNAGIGVLRLWGNVLLFYMCISMHWQTWNLLGRSGYLSGLGTTGGRDQRGSGDLVG